MRRWWWLAALVPAALATRALQARGALLYPDGYQYLLMAKGIAAHGRPIVTLGHGGDTWVPSADASVKPLFPALVGLLHVLGLPLRAAAEGITVLAGSAACVLVGALTKRLTNSSAAALAAGMLCVASPTLGHWAAFSGPDPLAQALALGAALAFLDRRPGLAGALAGLCVTARPEYALLVLPACLLSLRFATAACAAAAVVLAAVRPPLALNTASATVVGTLPGGIGALIHADWPLLVLGAVGLALAPPRHTILLGGATSALFLAYMLKDPGSTRYFAAAVPAACVAAGYALARKPGPLLAAAAAITAVLAPRGEGPAPDAFVATAARLPGSAPLYTAAPDAYALVTERPVRFLRPGVRGLILVDGAQRVYEPQIVVRGRIVRRIAPASGFVRPDGTVDERPIELVQGTARWTHATATASTQKEVRDEQQRRRDCAGEREVTDDRRILRLCDHRDLEEEVARDAVRGRVAALARDPNLVAVLDSGRDANAQPPLGVDQPGPVALVAGLDAAGRARLDAQDPRRGEVRDLPDLPGAAAVGALRLGLADQPVAVADGAQRRRLVLEQAGRSALRLLRPDRDPRVHVLAARRRLAVLALVVDPLVASTAVAVAVIEEARRRLRQHPVGLGQVAEALVVLRRVRDVRMAVAREGMECAADRLLVRVTRDAEELVVVRLDRSHLN
jgi:hypothetical protein